MERFPEDPIVFATEDWRGDRDWVRGFLTTTTHSWGFLAPCTCVARFPLRRPTIGSIGNACLASSQQLCAGCSFRAHDCQTRVCRPLLSLFLSG